MKIPAVRIQGFASEIERSGICSVLIYGPDNGGVSNLANKIAASVVPDVNDPFSTTIIDNERIAQDPSMILDELSAINLFGGKKLVLYKHAEANAAIMDSIKSAIEDLPADAKKASFLLITAGDLPATSALRKFYEAGKDVAALPCYVEDERNLASKIQRIFMQKGLKATERGIIEYLADSCQGDSKIIESEIDKLELYLGDVKTITLEDVLSVTGNTTETEIQDICNSICENKMAQAQMQLARAFDTGVQPIAIIRTLQRYMEKLHSCVQQIQNEGKTTESAIAAMRPPIFFKQAPIFRMHLNNMLKKPANNIWGYYSILYDAESEIKQSGADPELITAQAIASIK